MKIAFSIVSITGGSSSVPDFARVVVEFANADNSQVAQMQVNASNARLNFSENRYIVGEKRLDELSYSVGGQFSWRNVSVIRVYASAIDRLSVTNATTDGTKATITTSSSHNLVVGDYVSMFNVSSLLNGNHEVTDIVDGTRFKFASSVASSGGSPGTVDPNGTLDVASKEYFIALDALRLDNVSTANPLYGLTGYSVIQNIDELAIVKSSNTNNYIEYRFILDVT
jgi:hypothetical protein